MGHLLESFVVQQVIAQAGWTDGDLRFHHYRDKDKVEGDIVIVIVRGRDTWGIEVKASASVSHKDGHGLRKLAEACGDGVRGGVVLYDGNDTLPSGDESLLAVSLARLWDD